MLRMFVAAPRGQAADVYELLDQHHVLGQRSHYLNMGWWDDATNYDEAAEALAEQVGLAAGIEQGDAVLDVGFGFGDQDQYWLGRFDPAKITGINITPLHVTTAKRRFLDPRLDFRLGSATAMELPDASVERVTAVECAFHFSTRVDFLREAFRVLKPGGRLGACDILPRPGRHSIRGWLLARAMQAFWQIPPDNWHGIEEYRRRLEQVGFVDVDVRSIRDHVVIPFFEALPRVFRGSAAAAHGNPLVRRGVRVSPRSLTWFDYVLVSARKPD